MSEPNLLPCPLCGGSACSNIGREDDTFYWEVGCSNPKCGVGVTGYDLGKLCEQWNERMVTPDSERSTAGRLRAQPNTLPPEVIAALDYAREAFSESDEP